MDEINRKLIVGNSIVFPITKAANVMNLDEKITEVAPIPVISPSKPTDVNKVGSAWFDTKTSKELDEYILNASGEREYLKSNEDDEFMKEAEFIKE